MTATRTPRRPKPVLVLKPNGTLTPRVQLAGPEHFGILAIDCGKDASVTLLADFYGNTLLPPTPLPHTAPALRDAVQRLRQAMHDHGLRDVVVALEATGTYHRPPQRACRDAGFDTRLVHPFTAKQYRQPANPGDKTDANDTAAIVRATTQGFGLLEPAWPEHYRSLQLLRRHRRDLVDKNAALQCQIRQVLHDAMPGYAACFCHLWESPAPLLLARHTASPQALRDAGYDGLQLLLDQAQVRVQRQTLHKVLAWAQQAPPASPLAALLRRQLADLDDDRQHKSRQSTDLERELAHLAVQTPYVRLLALPGVNLVTVADLAGELGPIALYRAPAAITGRAGLVPSRYQSSGVAHGSGPLQRRGHRRLRAVLMQTADNLVLCNHHYKARADLWTRQGRDPRWLRVKVAKMFSRLAYALVAGPGLFPHEALRHRHDILGKLLGFHTEHHTQPAEVHKDRDAAAGQLPDRDRAAAAPPLQQQLDDLARQRGPRPLADIIPLVLARLGARVVQSQTVRERDPG